MNLATRGRRAAQGIHRAVEVMDMSMQSGASPTIERFDRFRGRRQRNRRIGAIVVAAAVVVTTVIVVASAIQRSSRQTGGRSLISPSEATRILDLVVIPYDEPPRGKGLGRRTVGASALGGWFDSGVAPRWPRIGFVDASQTIFNVQNNHGDFVGSITSWAAVYQDADAAAAAFPRFANRFATVLREGSEGSLSPERIGLGEEGWSYASSYCSSNLWRSGAVIMRLETCGGAQLRMMIDELSNAMDARAEAAGSSG